MSDRLVAVFGSGSDTPEHTVRAEALGTALGAAGFGVINGGYGGVMAASADGVRSAGGRAIGVTCAAFSGRADFSAHFDEIIEARVLTERLETLIRRAQGYVVLPGGNGTLVELALAWEHVRSGLVPARPLVAWEKPWRSMTEALARDGAVDDPGVAIVWVTDVDSAVRELVTRVPRAG